MMHFYYGSGSPWAWRVQLALEEKGLPYEASLLSFSDGDLGKPEYLAISPHGKVPALTDGDLVLYESQAILEYLEENYPARPLLPGDPADRALLRIEEIECTIYLAEVFFTLARLVFFTPEAERDPKDIAERRTAVHAELVRADGRAAARGGDYFMGKPLTRADISWIPFVELAGRAGVELDAEKTPWLVAWRDRMRERPSYQKSYPPHWREKVDPE